MEQVRRQLFACLPCLQKPTAGEILYKGKDIFNDELNVKKVYRSSTTTYKF